jgi:hypothetical protein
VVKLLAATRDPQHLPFIESLLGDSFHVAFTVLQHCFDNGMPEEQLSALMQVARRTHGQRVDLLSPVFREIARQVFIIKRRRLVVSAEHRFFLALLLNLGDHASVVAMVKDRYPEQDPVEVIARWVEEIAQIKGSDEFAPNPLGIEIGEDELRAFRHLLAGSDVRRPNERRPPEQSLDAGAEQLLGASFARMGNSRMFERLLPREFAAR